LEVNFVPTQFNMSALCAELVETTTVSGQRILYPCGDLADADGTRPLSEAGAVVDTVLCYRALPDLSGDVDALQRCLIDGEVDAVVFASPSAVQSFFARIEAQGIPPAVALVSIGPRTTAALRSIIDRAILEAPQASADGIAEALKTYSTS
jgi:uroporphyrinogen-III synthase